MGKHKSKGGRVKIYNRIEDVRSPKNIGAVLGILCRQPLRERLKLAFLIVKGPSKKELALAKQA